VAKHQAKSSPTSLASSTDTKSAANSFQTQLQELLKGKKYRQALEEIKKIKRSHPDITFTPPEAEIWLLRGQQELQKQDWKQAEKSFARALEMGLVGDAHYWQAKCLLEFNQLDAALKLLHDAFEADKLTKDYNISYLKLLLLKGDTATVEQLINQQAKRFSASQLHWVRGVLALKNGQPDTALTSFQKIKRPLTPGELPFAWLVYSQQAGGNWSAAANLLELKSGYSFSTPKYLTNPILERLAIAQQAKTGEPPLTPVNIRRANPEAEAALSVLNLLNLIEVGNYHEAAHALLQMKGSASSFAELKSLRIPLLTLAGQQALNQGELQCAELFWQPLLTETPFNPQLAVNLLEVLDTKGSERERQNLLTKFLKWLEQEGKQKPQVWPNERLKPTLAHLQCWLADTYMAMDRDRAALGALQQAERICPTSPEVLGRKGLVTASEGNYPEAIALLTQAIESGCRYEAVYHVLLGCYQQLDDKQAYKEARRRFGKYFDDVGIETEVEILPWIDALSTLNYGFFSRLIQSTDEEDPAIHACEVFVNAVQSPPNSGGRVSLNQAAAAADWEHLLQQLSGEEQIPVLQAIALAIHLFAKREKGIAAFTNQYLQRLCNLSTEHPEARIAHLVVLAIKENNPQKLESPLRSYLDTVPQPGNTLANIQLQARRFGTIQTLIPALDAALHREPQNPLLLLARATTYPVKQVKYEQLKQEGFELARRLQDAKALQAFREEQAFLAARETQSMMPEPEEFDNLDMSDMDDLIEGMLKKFFSDKLPKAEFERMLPELKQMMFNGMPSFDDDEDDDEDEIDLDFIFGNSPPKSKKRKGRKKSGFQELF
jgi:tetratricopeptide (TPR) repeat protein